MRNITLTFLVLGLSACASQSVKGPTDPQARSQSQRYLGEAISSFRSGKLSSVAEAIEYSLKFDPSNGLAYNLRALTKQRLGQFEEATLDFQKAIELAPQDATIRNNFGTLLCTQKRYPAAEQNFLFAADISTNSEPEIAYTNAGLCAQRAGQGEQAWQYFEKAVHENPGQPTALYHLALMSLNAGRAMDANTYLGQYREYAPHTAKSLFLAARIEHSLGNLNGVENYLSQMQSQFPNATELRQARQLVDPITKTLAPAPNYPGVVAFEPPPSLSRPLVNNPEVAVSTLEPPVIPIPEPLPAPTTVVNTVVAASPAVVAPVIVPPEVTVSTPAVVSPEMPDATGQSVFAAPVVVAKQNAGPVAVETQMNEAAAPVAKPLEPATSPFPPRNGPVDVKDSDWILLQDPRHYTLQILASDNSERLDDLIATDVAPDTLARFQFTRHDKVWHNLVLGNYAKNSDAQAALDALPPELKALRPWIRPFGSLQRVIKSATPKAADSAS